MTRNGGMETKARAATFKVRSPRAGSTAWSDTAKRIDPRVIWANSARVGASPGTELLERHGLEDKERLVGLVEDVRDAVLVRLDRAAHHVLLRVQRHRDCSDRCVECHARSLRRMRRSEHPSAREAGMAVRSDASPAVGG